MARKLNSTRTSKASKQIDPAIRYALTAIYGSDWPRMNNQALMTAIAQITVKR